ncbi:MAG TPA: DUF1844 domain-containing protein [bacterium]|nr:DUF1844 domain-containing protein [bacterium]
MNDQNEMNGNMHFLGLVSALASSAMQQMGKVANPATGKIERDMDAAKTSIDMLEMLKQKTQGNLTAQESGMLMALLSNLQLNYVDELNRGPAPAEKGPEEKKIII